jgi:hypothetical protein
MPVKPDEAVILITGLAVFFFFLSKLEKLKAVPYLGLFFAAYVVLLAGWVLTILEDLFLRETMNLLEHAAYAGSTVLLLLWIGYTFLTTGGNKG